MKQRGFGKRLADHLITPIYSNFVPKFYTPIGELGRAAIELAKNRWLEKELFTNAEMRELMSALPAFRETPASAGEEAKRDREL